MNINVEVRIVSPEIVAALLALAEAFPQNYIGTITPVTESERKIEDKKHAVVKEENKKEEAKAIALEDVRAKLASLSQAGKQKQVKALIKKFGANKLTEVAIENYEALLKEAEAI
ncbi:hypothetical protein [Clostridium butyricum]|uniref:hypothetical protein n=1 Tax=Clostridium butyricum TaxID=1492 RepID=UPI00129AD70E|nr:hypothetical protein [Clostridium butyricum]QGH20205.1 hypothetical protein EBL75_00840 [Clostridium butyricum]QGH24240.1 hypothetical protein EBQ27_00840 [Clostridium butyricum]